MFLQVKPGLSITDIPLSKTNSCYHMPAADAVDIKSISLCGDSKFRTENNSLEKMALALKLSEERILQAYKYWQKLV